MGFCVLCLMQACVSGPPNKCGPRNKNDTNLVPQTKHPQDRAKIFYYLYGHSPKKPNLGHFLTLTLCPWQLAIPTLAAKLKDHPLEMVSLSPLEETSLPE